MIIYNNLAALQTGNQLNINRKKGDKVALRLVTGEKFSSANGAASEYQISERMRMKIRGLNQCDSNVKEGHSLLNIAMDGVTNQVEIMKNIRALAMRGSDDIYTDSDRNCIQVEIDQMLQESDDIANETNFNGISLLNKHTLTSSTSNFNANAPYQDIPSSIPVISDAASATNHEYTVPQGSYTYISISGIGGATSTNVYDPNTTVPGAPLTNMPSVGDWVCDSTGNKTQIFNNSGVLCFNSTSGIVSVDVNGYTNGGGAAATSTNVFKVAHPPLTAMPTVGTTVCDSTGNTQTVQLEPGSGILSMWKSGGSLSAYELDFTNLLASSAGANLPTSLDSLGFSFNCSGCQQYVTIMFNAKTDVSQLYQGSTGQEPMCYVIGVKNVTNASSLAETIFNGLQNPTPALPASVDAYATIATTHDIKMNYYAATGKFTITKDGPAMTYLNGVRGEIEVTNFYEPYQHIPIQIDTKSNQRVNLYIGNTTSNVLFPSSAILPKDEEYPTDWPASYDYDDKNDKPMTETDKKKKWREEVWKYPANNVARNEMNVQTRESASKFLDHIDQALKYLLHTNTVIGAQASCLEFTSLNLTSAAENLTASESVLRDADMAKEYGDKVKYNLLEQACQTMLVQANQNNKSVISLLQ
ncbi:MAG: fliC [Firmicutes bacterium]|nr:fliC [Bacillota bacterium]